MKALLLRVGIDKGVGDCLAPLFENGSFLYLPIPERKPTNEKRTYAQIVGHISSILLQNIPKKLWSKIPHYDPEFEKFTYGDPTPNKRRQLLKLKPGDLLVFYAGLEPTVRFDVSKLYIIGYFTIKKVHDFNGISNYGKIKLARRLSNNAHIKRRNFDKNLVVVEGDPNRSALLSRALPLGNPQNRVIDDLIPVLGYGGSILRAIGHWINDTNTENLLSYLCDGLSSFIQKDSRFYSYVLASDTGFAPNLTSGICTLACCKPVVRRVAQVGDWIIGTLPQRYGVQKLGYCMKVSEIMSFSDYYCDKRFKSKKPQFDIHGDNIYYKHGGKYLVEPNLHHNDTNLHHDTKTDRVLIGYLFWYFGANAVDIPVQFNNVIKKGPNHKKIVDIHLIKDLISWLNTHYHIGVHGLPRDKVKTNNVKQICSRKCK